MIYLKNHFSPLALDINVSVGAVSNILHFLRALQQNTTKMLLPKAEVDINVCKLK